ncbi:hypothetical protein F5H01DRAFT_414700 [Linnemannia elongata]|nr:hypothetical protein F5H01DRAFT_414700 [Linnemannia elongata]
MSRRRAAFAQYNNQLYFHGGILANGGGTGDLSALNLNSSWSTTNPAWTTLASGNWVWHHAMIPIKPEHSAGLGSASTKGFLLSVGGYPPPLNAFFSAYNIQTGSWANLTTPSPYTGLEGHTAVADPATGLVYVMGGFYNNNPQPNPKVGNLLTVFDPKTAAVMQRVEATDANNMTGGSAVWSTRRKTVLLFEGSRAVVTGDVKGIVQTAVQEYDTTIGQWKTFETKGTFPSPRLDACAVESDDGSKVILFGGAADANVILNTIHILDVDTAQWTQGQPAPGPRTQMVCAYHSGLFVAFGGTANKNQTENLYANQPIVYDVNKNQWVEHYSLPDAVHVDSNGSTSDGISAGEGSSTESSPEEKSHMQLVIGAGVGAIVVMMICAVILGYIVQKRRRDRKAVERDARTTALLSDGEDHYSHRRRTIHKRAARAINSNSNDNNRVMTAADHYAAAQAIAELQAARDAAIAAAIAANGGEGDGVDENRRANSWDSDTFSQVTASEYESTILMNVAKARRLSDATSVAVGAGVVERVSMDPQTYYLYLLHQQRALQARHRELLLGDNRAVTAVGSVEVGLQQSDKIRRSPHSTPVEKGENETLLGCSTVSGDGNGSSTITASAEKAISFVKRESSSSIAPTSVRRSPHSVVGAVDSGLSAPRLEGAVEPNAK